MVNTEIEKEQYQTKEFKPRTKAERKQAQTEIFYKYINKKGNDGERKKYFEKAEGEKISYNNFDFYITRCAESPPL